MNRKSTKERAQILRLLVEGNSMRATERAIRETQDGCSINTITKLLTEVGEACAWYQDQHLMNLPCTKIQIDEIWSFVYAKNKNLQYGMEDYAGDIWTFTSICQDTKLVPSWCVGQRNASTAKEFIADLAARMSGRIQLTSDGFAKYRDAVEDAFGPDIDYGMLYKIYDENNNRYVGAKKVRQIGGPDTNTMTTAHVERQNLTMRMSIRRFTRKTNGFSKKIENHAHAVALHFMHYNFVRIHKTLRMTPAMAAGITKTLWSLEDVVKMADEYRS